MKALFTSKNLIGDALYVGPALRAWIQQQTKPVDIWLLTLNDHVTPLYEGMVRNIPRSQLASFCVCYERPQEVAFDFEHVFDVSTAFKLSDQKKQHLATSYSELLREASDKAGVQRNHDPITVNMLKPVYIPDWRHSGEIPLSTIPEGLILVSMFSQSCTSRDPKIGIPNKMLPFEKWRPMIAFLRKQFPNTPIRFLGAPTDVIPDELNDLVKPEEVMFGIPLNCLALIMRKAKLLVTIDNGMAHLAASQECPTFLMYPHCLGPHYILPIGNPYMVWVHMNPVTVKAEKLLASLEFAVKRLEKKHGRP